MANNKFPNSPPIPMPDDDLPFTLFDNWDSSSNSSSLTNLEYDEEIYKIKNMFTKTRYLLSHNIKNTLNTNIFVLINYISII